MTKQENIAFKVATAVFEDALVRLRRTHTKDEALRLAKEVYVAAYKAAHARASRPLLRRLLDAVKGL